MITGAVHTARSGFANAQENAQITRSTANALQSLLDRADARIGGDARRSFGRQARWRGCAGGLGASALARLVRLRCVPAAEDRCVVLTLVVDRQRLSSIAHSRHPIAAPVSGVNVNRLLRRADQRPAARILDLGCGEAAWALQALAYCPDGHADGVDISRDALERAAEAAAERGLADRLTLHERDARRYVADGDYDLVMCIGSAHAFGGFDATLRLAGRHVNPDGILLVGEGFWQVPPTPEALVALDAAPEDFTDLAGLVDAAEQAGWTRLLRPAHVVSRR